MKRWFAVYAGLLFISSCAKRVEHVTYGLPAPSSAATAHKRLSRSGVEETMQRQIQNAIDMGDGDYAMRQLRHKVATGPDDLRSRLQLARHYNETGFPDVALEHYRIAALRFPDSAEVAVLLAKALRDADLKTEAQASLDAFTSRQPKASAEAWSWLGMLQDETGDLVGAERSHRTALALDSGRDSFHNNLGYNLLLQGNTTEAESEFRQAIAMNPRSIVAHNNLGLALAAKPAEALSQWQAASDPATAHNNLAAILMEQGKYAEARAELNVALGYKKDHGAALRNMQLLSKIDGGSVVVPARDGRSGWDRIRHGIRLMILGDEERHPVEGVMTVDTASK